MLIFLRWWKKVSKCWTGRQSCHCGLGLEKGRKASNYQVISLLSSELYFYSRWLERLPSKPSPLWNCFVAICKSCWATPVLEKDGDESRKERMVIKFRSHCEAFVAVSDQEVCWVRTYGPSLQWGRKSQLRFPYIEINQWIQSFIFRGHKDKIFVVKWDPHNPEHLVTAGMKHIKFWTQTGGGFTSKRGTFGDVGKNETMMCVTYAKIPDLVFSGGASGKVYVWQRNTLKNAVQAHEGPVFAMQVLEKVMSSVNTQVSPLVFFTNVFFLQVVEKVTR